MTFQAVVPSGGLVGWRFLQRTYDAQLQTFSASSVNERDTEYFLKNISSVHTAEDLVSDRRLLQVALGAFGLQDDLDNRYFVQKVLSDGTQADDALANKLSDSRYSAFSQAFGFGPGDVLKTGNAAEMEKVAKDNIAARFEISVGESGETLRIALYAQHTLADLAAEDSTEDTKWYDLMGLTALRSMMETALGLPSDFAQLDIDKQLEIFKEKLSRVTGSSDLAQFSDPEVLDQITDTYLARSQIAEIQNSISPVQTALILLGAGT